MLFYCSAPDRSWCFHIVVTIRAGLKTKEEEKEEQCEFHKRIYHTYARARKQMCLIYTTNNWLFCMFHFECIRYQKNTI